MASKKGSVGTPLSRQVALARKRRAAESKETTDKVTLETVLGITCYSGSSLSSSESCIAYPAGCVAVLFYPKGKGKQVHIHNRKPISCLSFSPNGGYLATGESGHEPCVRVWALRESITQVCRLKEHHYGVQCVAFSPSGKHLVSVGYQHDRQIIVWSWKAGTKLVHGKFANKVNGIAFSSDFTNKLGSLYFVTVHNRRVQFWYYNSTGKEASIGGMLKSRSAILGQLHENHFVAVCCGKGPLTQFTYTLTRSGQLCMFDSSRNLHSFTTTVASPAYSVALNDQHLFCGCSNGVIRIYNPRTLEYLTSMPHPHPLGINLASFDSNEKTEMDKHVYADAIAMVIHNNRLSTVYNDHSVFVWDVANISKQIGAVHSFLFHSAGVWDICTYPCLDDSPTHLLPPSCFISCSSDGTVRFWSLKADKQGDWSRERAYSKELLRIIYSEPEDKLSLKDSSNMPGSAATDSTKGVKCIQVRPDGQHIATGDRMGNLKVYDLQFMDKVYCELAHDAEILSLTYSPSINNNQFLSSASRDRMVHIFSLSSPSSYQPIMSINDHSASVTAVRFVRSNNGALQLLSSGADKSIIFHSMDQTQDGELTFYRANNVVSKATIYDMDIDAVGKHVVTACQDRVLRFYLVNGGKQKTVIKAPTADTSEGSLLKVSLDPSGLFAAASCADKSVLIFDVFSGECVAKLTGHSECVTQVRFSRDCRFLYSASGDSCIFVWKLSKKLTQAMHSRLSELGLPLPAGRESPSTPPSARDRETFTKIRTSTPHAPRVVSVSQGLKEGESVDAVEPDFEHVLPSSSPRRRSSDLDSPLPPDGHKPTETGPVATQVEGRWAERVGGGDLVFAVQEQDSDIELDDLSAEMSRIVFEKQTVMEVIDLTEDDDELEVPLQAAGDNPTDNSTDSNESKGSEQEVKFYTSTDDIDPSLFSVTTPNKAADRKDESEEEESPQESPSDSPIPLNKGIEEEDSSFLRTNFESLEKTGDSNFLKAPSPRQSISAKFLERSLQKSLLEYSHVKSTGESPVLPETESEAAGIFIFIQDTSGLQQDNDATPVATAQCAVEVKTEPVDCEPELRENEREQQEDTEQIITTMKRRLSFEAELDKTRKKLIELGYAVKSSKQETPTHAPSESLSSNNTEDQQSHESMNTPLTAGSQKSVKVKSRRTKKPPPSATDDSGLMGRAKSLTENLGTSFRALVELHDQTLSSESHEESDDVINFIATYMTTHKSNVVSMVNRNRRSWRERVKAKSSSPDHNISPGMNFENNASPLVKESDTEDGFHCEGGDRPCEEEMESDHCEESGACDSCVSGVHDTCVSVSGDPQARDSCEESDGEDDVTVSRQDVRKVNSAMRTMSELANDLSSVLTAWSKLEQSSSICDT